jgi:alkylation response protein AidB-like acyl-CoA dehydrogenase
VEATLLGEAGAAAAPFARTLVEAAVCLANEMAGVSERLREDALAYAQDAHAVRPRRSPRSSR